MRCFVPTCSNASDRRRPQGVSFHKIPASSLKEEWLLAIKRSACEATGDRRICSEHFNGTTDFFMGNRRILKPHVVPSLKLPPTRPVEVYITCDTPTEYNIPSDEGIIAPVGFQDEACCSTTNAEQPSIKKESEASPKGIKRSLHSYSSGSSTPTNGSLKAKRISIRLDHNYSRSPGNFKKQLNYQNQRACFYKSTKRPSKRRKQQINHLKEIIFDLNKKNSLSTTALEHLEQSFSGTPQALMKRMLRNNRRGKITISEYPPELKRFAKTLQFYSDKAYRYVREVFDLALPAESTITAWLSKVDCEPGFSKPSLDALKVEAENYHQMHKKTLLCSLIMNEISIKKEVTVEPATLKTRGYVDTGCDIEGSEELELAQEALVFMVVGVNHHFKVPIAYFFVNKLTGEEKANITREALRQLHPTGVRILSLTFNGPNAHFKMMKELGCQITNFDTLRPFFKHPVDGSKIFVVLDVCHMLKQVRNNWEKLGKIKDPEGGIIDWNFIKELNNIQQQQGFVLADKLRDKHINFRKAIMKVNLAAQTLSSSVADALEFLCNDLNLTKFQGVEPTVNFIRIIDGLFDLLNSRNPFGRGYKTPLKTQNQNIWRPFMESSMLYLKSCTRLDNKPLVETQNKTPFVGFIVSASALMQIYEKEVKSGNLKYLLTYKFSQDHLELFFCSIRSRNGWVVNPTCLQFIRTFKRLLIHNDVRNSARNCLAQDQTKVLTVTSTKATVQETDIFIQRRRDQELDVLDLEIEFSMPLLPTKLGEYAENAVAYIAGYVIEMIQKHNSCNICLEALSLENDDVREKLIKIKSRGGLHWPTYDLCSICFKIEKKMQVIFEIHNKKLPARNVFINLLLRDGIKYYTDRNLFKCLEEHIFDQTPLEVPHKRSLIDDIIKAYAKIRLHSLSKTVNDTICGTI